MVLLGRDGIELMHDIIRIADVRVVFLSVYGRDEVIARALEEGATDCIVKPFSPMELVAHVRAALRRFEEPEREDESVVEGAVIPRVCVATRDAWGSGRSVQSAVRVSMVYRMRGNR